MPTDIASLLLAVTLNLVTMAAALPVVMGPVNPAARRAQAGVALQALGWALLLASGRVDSEGVLDRLLSTLSMAGLAAGLALLATAFDRWCGRRDPHRLQALVTVVMPLGYALGFSNYPFRVGWANGLLALQMAMTAAALLRTPAAPVGQWRGLLAVCLLVQVVMTAWRGVLGAFYTARYPTFLTPHSVNFVFAVVVNVTAVLLLVGILLAHRDEAARALERLATLDDLTGVFNRRAWLASAHTKLALSLRYGHPVAVVMIDLDYFKHINDTRGHEAGDRALQFVAQALQASVRADDVLGRYGGEEFCVLMDHADSSAASTFDRRMREQLACSTASQLGFELDYSAGIAVRMSGNDTLQAMLQRADATLYRAKAQGRSRTLDAQGVRLCGA